MLENAVKYTEATDAIELRASGRRDDIVIEVADEGCGIAAEAAANVFERFARADPSRARVSGGAGLGLAIVDAIVRAHGGTVKSTRAPTARPWLPVARVPQRHRLGERTAVRASLATDGLIGPES